jgi:hypothetical protein
VSRGAAHLAFDPNSAQKASWGDPVMRAKLANAYVRAGGDDEKAARILGVTVGSGAAGQTTPPDVPA